MNDSVKIKSGVLNGRDVMPNLTENEIAYQREEKALYIGTPDGNVKLCDAGLENRIKVIEDNPSGVFYAIYGETTVQEIRAAYDAGKAISCKLLNDEDYGRNLWLTDVSGEDVFFFSAVYYYEPDERLMIITALAESNNNTDTQWYEIYKQPLVMQEEIDKINARLDAMTQSE